MAKYGPQPIRQLEHVWIPMSDGCRLAARVWFPEGAEAAPVPGILEYIPYRKRDFTAVRDGSIHRYFAAHGYGCVRVDLRGSGDSEGILRDEYLQQELDDGLAVLRWMAEQPWCNGKVGMIGLSWGGFNGLQIAALKPPELQAVISVCSSDDRFADDVHYMGGCLLTDNLSWASTMFAYNSCPPDPQIVGEKWREMWLERLEGSGLWLKNWLEHQTRDEYWKHASVCENYDDIQCPVFIVSGWADGYSNTVFRLLEHLKVPRKGLVGAWGHKYPQSGALAPAIGFLTESLRWWDRWLKGDETGVEDEPMLRVWMQDVAVPTLPKRPGRWVAEPGWPTENVEEHSWRLGAGILHSDGGASAAHALKIQSPLSVGLFAGKWCSYGTSADLPSDQREEDGGSLTFDCPPLKNDIEILGAPELELELEVDKPNAMVAVRLNDVAPDGKATRLTFGVLNLTHRDSHEHPEPVEPGKRMRIPIRMNYMAQRLPRGHVLRVSISTSYWPLVWPSPEPFNLVVHTEGSRLVLPLRISRSGDKKLRQLPAKDGAATLRTTMLAPPHREWSVVHNLATNESTLQVINNDQTIRIEDYGWQFGRTVEETYSYVNYRYDTVKGRVEAHRHFKRGDWSAKAVTRTVLTSTRTHFRVQATLDAYEGDSRIFAKTWDELVPRNLL